MLATQQAKEVFLADGTDLVQIVGQGGAIKSAITEKGGVQVFTNLLAADGAIPNRVPGFYIISKTGSAAALTLAAPVAGTDDGMEIEITVGTNFAHAIAITNLQVAGAAGNPKASLTAVTTNTAIGTTAYLTAYNGLWIYANGGVGTWTVA